jgi:hypothetical protein
LAPPAVCHVSPSVPLAVVDTPSRSAPVLLRLLARSHALRAPPVA